eukprot:10297999-Alexandrium_andersonii.AAC.1
MVAGTGCRARAWLTTCLVPSLRPGTCRTTASARRAPTLAAPCCLSIRARRSSASALSGFAASWVAAACRLGGRT